MKLVRIVLAPKAVMIVLAAILFGSLHTSAQEKAFAYNAARVIVKEQPGKAVDKETFSMQITLPEKDSLLFNISVENPNNEKLTLYIRDNNNNTLHREALPLKQHYVARYNLQSLDDGQYVVEIRSGRNLLGEKAIGIKTQTTVARNVAIVDQE